jgi:type I restriction enzyme S subunit
MNSNLSFPIPNSELPRGWRWVKLGEVCMIDSNQVLPNTDLVKELPYIGLEHIESGTGKVIGKINDKDGKLIESITFQFDCRHVLYGKLRPYLNKVVTPDFEGRCTTELLPLLPKDGCDRDYLAWIFRWEETVSEAMRHKTGTRMPRADMDELFKMLIPLPPLPEQIRIAAKIQELMQEVERARTACEKQLEAAKALLAAFLREVFESEEAQKWERKRLGEVCQINPSRPKNFHRSHDSLTSFVPMAAVDEDIGTISKPEVMPYSKVSK